MAFDYVADLRQPSAVRRAIVAEIAELMPDALRSIVDVGCGDGAGTVPLIALAAGDRLLGVDPSVAMVERARATHPGIRFELGDFAAIPSASGSVGIVTAFNSWHHVADRVAALREVRRVLEPGGRFAVVNAMRDDLSAQLVHQLFPEFHVHERAKHPSREEFVALAREHGFEFEHTSTQEFELALGSRHSTIELVRGRPFFGLRLMPESDFERGFAAFAERVTALADDTVVTRSRSTLIVLRSSEGAP